MYLIWATCIRGFVWHHRVLRLQAESKVCLRVLLKSGLPMLISFHAHASLFSTFLSRFNMFYHGGVGHAVFPN